MNVVDSLHDWNHRIRRLLLGSKGGDVVVLSELWDLVKPSMMRHCHAFFHRVGVSDSDPLGFCYLAFHEAVTRYDEQRGMQFLPYCLTILRYKVIELAKKRRCYKPREMTVSHLVESTMQRLPAGRISDEELLNLIVGQQKPFEDEVILQCSLSECGLGDIESRVVWMMMDGYTPTQIIRELNIPKSSYYYIRRRLQEALASVLLDGDGDVVDA